MTLALVTPPALEPLTLAEVKAHLRVDHGHEDGLIADLLRAARLHAENRTGCRFLTQVWRQYAAGTQSVCFAVHLRPVQAVEAITVFDREGNPRTLASDDYELSRDPEQPRLRLHVDAAACANGIEADLRVGFGDLGVDVPDTLRRAILLLCAHWYEFRGVVHPSEQPVSMPPGFDALVGEHARVRL